ncbi:MAG: DNA polymerase-3 subunit gamma/tau [Saprospiraceae bacterium]
MSNFVVSARKYRPTRFEDVVGQEHVSQTLKNALQNDHLAHAFLFTGPRGVGKTTCARILAKVMNCMNVGEDYEPCNECSSCKSFSENASFNIMELDAASNNSVDHIRQLVEQVRFQPQQGKYKIFIIDEVHMLSQAAFNAFLKTLEEPPPYAIFILATTEKHKIIPTILSRCQIFDFKRIQIQAMVTHLQGICAEEGIEADKDALHIIAQKADGALRDSLSIFDRIVSFSGKKITYEDVISNLNVLDYDYFFKVTDALLTEDVSQLMLIFDDILRKGFEADIFINGLAEHLRNLLVCKDVATLQLLEVSDKLKDRYQQQANLAPTSFVLSALSLANDCDINFKMARNKRLHTEMALIKMAYIARATAPASAMPMSAAPLEKKTIGVNNAAPVIAAPQNVAAPAPQSTPVASLPAVSTPEPTPQVLQTPVPVEPITQPIAAAPANTAQEQEQPYSKKPSLSLGKSTGSFSMNLADIEASVAKETVKQAAEDEQKESLTPEILSAAWEKYIAQAGSANLQNIMRSTEVVLISDTEIELKVTSKLAENTIRQDLLLMEFLRKELKRPILNRKLSVDKSKLASAPERKKPMSDKDRLLRMNELNPLVETILKKFDMKFDEQ